jgi:predicted MFS family arabinose efflux permease
MFTALGLGGLLTQTLLVGRVARRWGEPAGIRIGFLTGAVGFLGVALAGQPAAITVAVGLTSVAMGLIRPSLAALNSRLTTSGYGTSLGLQTSFDSLGRTLGPLWAGTIYDAFIVGPFVAAAAVYLLAGAAALRLTVPMSTRTPPR